MKIVMPMVMRKDRASILRDGRCIIKSPTGLAKIRITRNDTITAVIMIHILSVKPIAVITEST